MRSLPFPRRLQLVKLLRAHGLRDVERLREDELKEALVRLSVLLPDLQQAPRTEAPPPASITGSHRAEHEPVLDDEDRWCSPRFREPKVLLPEGERTFLRLVAVKPRLLFFTWDLAADVDRVAPARLEIHLRDVLGDPPSAEDVSKLTPAFTVDVDLRAPGWYVTIGAERWAVVAVLVQGERRIAVSNLALTPPARPAPHGPLWMATVRPDVDRRLLRKGGLLRGKLPDGAALETRGEVLPEPALVELDVPASSFRFRDLTERPSSVTSHAARSPSSTSSSSFATSVGRSG